MKEMSVRITGEQKVTPETMERMTHGRPAQPAAGSIVVDYDLELHPEDDLHYSEDEEVDPADEKDAIALRNIVTLVCYLSERLLKAYSGRNQHDRHLKDINNTALLHVCLAGDYINSVTDGLKILGPMMTVRNIILLRPHELQTHLSENGLQTRGDAGLSVFLENYASPALWLHQNIHMVRQKGLGLRGLTMDDVKLEIMAPEFYSLIQAYAALQQQQVNWWPTETPRSKQDAVAPWDILIIERYLTQKTTKPSARRSHTPPWKQQTSASSSRKSRPHTSPKRPRDPPKGKTSRRLSKSPDYERKIVLLSPRSSPSPRSPTRPTLEPEKEKQRDLEENSNQRRAPSAESTQAPSQPPAKKHKEDKEESPNSHQLEELKEILTMMTRRNEIVDKNMVRIAEIQAKMLRELQDIKAQRSYPEPMVYMSQPQTGYYTTMVNPAQHEPLAASLQAAEILNTTILQAEPAKAVPQPAVPQPGSSNY